MLSDEDNTGTPESENWLSEIPDFGKNQVFGESHIDEDRNRAEGSSTWKIPVDMDCAAKAEGC